MNDNSEPKSEFANDFRMGQWVFCRSTKDYAKITNGIPIDAKGNNAQGQHDMVGLIVTEGVAIRFIGLSQDGKPILAFTYRDLKASYLLDNLSIVLPAEKMTEYEAILQTQIRKAPRKQDHFNFIGRV